MFLTLSSNLSAKFVRQTLIGNLDRLLGKYKSESKVIGTNLDLVGVSRKRSSHSTANDDKVNSLTQHANDVLLGVLFSSFGAIHVVQNTSHVTTAYVFGQHVRASQLDGYQHVQDDDNRHRQNKEQKGRDLEGVLDQYPLYRAPRAIQDDCGGVDIIVHYTELNGLRHGETQSHQPDGYDELNRPGQL